MNTPSHLLINAAIRTWAGPRRIPSTAFLFGAVMPDMPLLVLWLGGYLYFRYVQNDPSFTLMDTRLDVLYFTDPFWKAAHNLLHAPLILLTIMASTWRARMQPGTRAAWWFWFAAGCLVHTLIDIPTHANDGPLIFFPLE